MTENEQKLNEQIAEMEGDIRATVITFLSLMKTFNITPADFKSGGGDILSKIPGLLTKISMQLASGTFDTQSLANFSSIAPIMEKYKYLVEDVIETTDGK